VEKIIVEEINLKCGDKQATEVMSNSVRGELRTRVLEALQAAGRDLGDSSDSAVNPSGKFVESVQRIVRSQLANVDCPPTKAAIKVKRRPKRRKQVLHVTGEKRQAVHEETQGRKASQVRCWHSWWREGSHVQLAAGPCPEPRARCTGATALAALCR
jgi:hypothetical protein